MKWYGWEKRRFCWCCNNPKDKARSWRKRARRAGREMINEQRET